MKRLLILISVGVAALALLLAIRLATRDGPGGAALAPSGSPASALLPSAADRPGQDPELPELSVPESPERRDGEGPSIDGAARRPLVADPPVRDGAGEDEGPLILEVEPGVAHFSGFVTAIEWNGVVHSGAGGQLRLTLMCDGRFRPMTVSFEGGTWSALLDPAWGCRALWIDAVTVDGRPALLDAPRGRTSIPRDRELPVTVRLPRPTILHVLEAGSGLALEDVALAPASYDVGPGYEHPGAGSGARIAARGLASPVILDGHLERMREAGDLDPPRRSGGASEHRRWEGPKPAILVGAPGYAWERLDLELLLGRETRVTLSPGAELEVHVTGVDADLGGDLRLYGADPLVPYLEESFFGDRDLVVRGLRPGIYRAAVELGPFGAVEAVLAERSVTLRAGERGQVHLFCVTPSVHLTADAAGVVAVPADWTRTDLTLGLRLVGPNATGAGSRYMARTRRGFSGRRGSASFLWSIDELQVGRYELSILDPPFQALVELPASGRKDLRHELPPPVELACTVLDAVRAEPHPTQAVRWRPTPVEGLPPLPWTSALADPEEAGLRLAVPAGSLDLFLELEGYLPHAETLELSAKSTAREHVIRLLPRTAIALRLVEGGSLLELPPSWKPTLSPQSPSALTLPAEAVPHERRYFVSEPGRYTLDLPLLPGFRPLPPVTIEVLPGRVSEHVVELERE